MKCLPFLLFSLSLMTGMGTTFSGAQNSFYLKPSLSFGHEQLQIQDDVYHIPGTSLKIEVLKFYIAHMTVSGECDDPSSKVDDYSLIDFFEDTAPVKIHNPCKISPATNLSFQLGVDPAIQEAGVQSGVLDPMRGMYWTWNSGYIHFKLELKDTISSGPDREIVLHLGGYRGDQSTIQQVLCKNLSTDNNQLCFDIKPLIDYCQSQGIHKVMSPGQEAVQLSKIIAHSFFIRQQ
jgi:hypothetical protein